MVNAFKYYSFISSVSETMFVVTLNGVLKAIDDCKLLDDRGCTVENAKLTFKQIQSTMTQNAEDVSNPSQPIGLPRCKFIECFFRIAALRYQTLEKRTSNIGEMIYIFILFDGCFLFVILVKL